MGTHTAAKITERIHPCDWCDHPADYMITPTERDYLTLACTQHTHQRFPGVLSGVSLGKSTDAPGFRPRHANESGYDYQSGLGSYVDHALTRNDLRALEITLDANALF